jgi:hypothetical protein
VKRNIPDEVMKNTYLQYLELYLSAKDENGSLFRTFVDNWYAYHKGGPLLNRNGNPKWFNNPDPIKEREAFLSMDYVSVKAMKLINSNGCGDRLVKDHSVPVKVLRKLIVNQGSGKILDISRIQEFLEKYYRLGVITKDEDKQFGREGLTSEMPKNWDEIDPFARYHAVGIIEATPIKLEGR